MMQVIRIGFVLAVALLLLECATRLLELGAMMALIVTCAVWATEGVCAVEAMWSALSDLVVGGGGSE